MAIATAVRLDENWKDANDVLRDAVRAERRADGANLDWGTLLLEKHNAADAEASFREVLKVDPDNPDAHVGLARVALADRYDAPAARDELAPRAGGEPGPRRRAGAAGGAGARRRGLGRRRAPTSPPSDGPTRAIRAPPRVAAAAALLLDDRAGYDRARASRSGGASARRRDSSPSWPRRSSRQRRYDDARAVADGGRRRRSRRRRAASPALATTLLRLGDETAGLDALRRAWKRDPYNVRTYNLLNLYEKVIPARYTTVAQRAPPLSRSEPAARTAITEVVAPFLEERYRDYVARYGVRAARAR